MGGVFMRLGAYGGGRVGMGLRPEGDADLAWLVGGIALGSMIGSVLSANVAALRTRRDHLQELFGSLPAPPEARTAGILLGLVVGPGALAVVLSGLSWIVFERSVCRSCSR